MIIKSQLQDIIYAGTPKDQVPQASVTETATSGAGVLDFVIGFVKILGYILLGALGIGVLVFLYYKATNKNENMSFQDFIIEKFSG
jgi:hypothetical protein